MFLVPPDIHNLKYLIFILFLHLPVLPRAQQIIYATAEKGGRRSDFEIIGKVSDNFVIFKNGPSETSILLYDDNMQLLNRVPLPIPVVPEKSIYLDFIAFEQFFYVLCEYQKKNIVFLSAIKIEGQGKKMSGMIGIDSTLVDASNTDKIYTKIISEDHRRWMILKVATNNSGYSFTTFLFDKNLNTIASNITDLPAPNKNSVFSNYTLDNDGELVFTQTEKIESSVIDHFSLITKSANASQFNIHALTTKVKIKDDMLLEVDNVNKRYLLSAFCRNKDKEYVDGIYTMIWNKIPDSLLKESVTTFDDNLRRSCKSSQSNLKTTFEDYHLIKTIPIKTGGYLIISESEFSSESGYAGVRLHQPAFGHTLYSVDNAENILVLNFNKDGMLEWNNVLHKSQGDPNGNNQISFGLFNTGKELHFLYNEKDKNALLLTDQVLTSDGQLQRQAVLHNLDKGYTFMPKLGKQVSPNEMIIPCYLKFSLSFAKLKY